jgi:hypothetical protein
MAIPRDESDERIFAQSRARAAANAPAPVGTPFGQAGAAAATGQGASIAENYRLSQIQKPAAAAVVPVPTAKATVVSTYTDPATGDVIALYSDNSKVVLSKGTKALEAQQKANAESAANRAAGQSAYDLLLSQFKQYGLETLVEPLKGLITTGASPAEFTIKLRETDAYKKRFAGNAARVQKGLRALDEAEYVALEDQYQNVMRNYGLPASYYTKDAMGTQQGFTNLIAGDVSAAELESRVQQATDVIDKGPKEYMDAIKQFYPDIERGDLLAYVLDPDKALTKIQAKIGAAKIGGEYLRAGLTADAARAEELQRQGVTAEAARQGAQAVLSTAPRGNVLADIYQTGPYGQTDVEAEVYGLAGATEARKKREKIVGLEKASFSGTTGAATGALGRERAMGQGQI